MRLSLSLRTRVVVIVLVAAIGPLTLTGMWLAAGVERSGEQQLRERIDQSVVRAAQNLGARWVARRSHLLALVESPAVQTVLATESRSSGTDGCHEWPGALTPVDDIVSLTVRDTANTPCWRWFADRAPASPVFNVGLDVFAWGTNRRIGELVAELRVGGLLTLTSEPGAGTGAELALVDRRSGALLSPFPFDPGLASQGRFTWGGEEWLASRRTMDEPPIEIIAAAPLTPYLAPFAQARRRGVTALVVVTVLACVAILILTHQTTRSLGRLSLAATAVARGEFDRTVAASGSAEVEELAVAFNTMTENLRRTLAELARREAVAAVGEFASSLAHEVRNPLTSIRIDLQRLEEQLPATSTLRSPLERALHSIARLDASVSGALRIARSGQLIMEAVDLESVLDGVVAEASPEAAEGGVRLVREHGSARLGLRGDGAALHQLFLNLVLNAVQAVRRGGRVTVSAESTEGEIVIRVCDDGAGIPAELHDRIFVPFYSTRRDGTGLGLPIARRIALAHGGDIIVDPAAPAGATFVVTLPDHPLA